MTNIVVSVKLSSGRTARFPLSRWSTVAELCNAVAEEEKVSAEVVTLKFDGKVLRRSKRIVDDYGVREEMVLKVKLITKKSLQVHLSLPGDEVVSFEIYNTSEMSEIKGKLLEAKPDLMNKIADFMVGQMKLNLTNHAYEDCLEDGEKINVTLQTPAGTLEDPVEIGEEDRQEVMNSFASSMTSLRKIDVVFSFDTTGSMFSLLSTIRETLRESILRLMGHIPNIRIGIMAHGDYCDERLYVLRKYDLSSDVSDIVSFVDATNGSGGEGNFACYEWVLRHANGLSWREDAAKALVIIGDVVPHPTSYTDQRVDWRAELDSLCDKGVKVYGVQARNFQPANSFYGYMARKSGGAHIKFQHFSLITDMFMAVCYRESGDAQLQAYVDEVRNEGRMTEEMMDVMQQLEKEEEEETEEGEKEEETEGESAGASAAAAGPAEAAPSGRRRQQEEPYVNEAWWDATLDCASVSFIYEETIWKRKGEPYPSSSFDQVHHVSMKRNRFSKRISKNGCGLM